MTKRIVSKPGLLGGEPCYEGTRIPHKLIKQLMADGTVTAEDVAVYYPSLTAEDVSANAEDRVGEDV